MAVAIGVLSVLLFLAALVAILAVFRLNQAHDVISAEVSGRRKAEAERDELALTLKTIAAHVGPASKELMYAADILQRAIHGDKE